METDSSKQPPVLNMPLAIIIAGALIAGAVYLSGGVTTSDSSNGDVVGVSAEDNQPARPAAQPPGEQPSIGDIREVSDEDHIRGADDARVTIIEYSDPECAFCQRFHPTLKQIVDEYPDDVRWVYRHFVLGRFPNSTQIAMATECAAEQGKFWEVADIVLDENRQTQVNDLSNIAEEAGVADIGQFDDCMESEKYAERISEDTADARVAGGQGTPYSVVIGPDGQKLPLSGAQPFASVKQLVDEVLDN